MAEFELQNYPELKYFSNNITDFSRNSNLKQQILANNFNSAGKLV